VVMYSPSALPCSTTFVSPPTIGTPARRAAAPAASSSARRTAVGVPASTMRLQRSARGTAPATARSFTVPLTARSPIEPPGKRSGRTTKLSVVIARIALPTVSRAASSRRASLARSIPAGTMSRSTSRLLALPPAPCAMSMCASANDTRGTAMVLMSDRRGGRPPVHVVVVGGARALRRHHQRADRKFRRAFAAEQLALMRLQHALEHFAALRGLGIGDLHSGHLESALGVPGGVLGPKL